MEEVESEQFGICVMMDSRKKKDVDKSIKCRSKICMTSGRHLGNESRRARFYADR